MERIPLNGEWALSYFTEGEVTVNGPDELGQKGITTVPAEVPGNVELDLVRAGKLPDPFHGLNIYELKPLEACQWWYTTTFETPDEARGKNCRLVFHGLDCIATIWLNGVKLGEAGNMFIAHAFPLEDRLHSDGRNELAVQLRSPVNVARGYRYEPSQAALATNHEQIHLRKAPHMFGWDIAPRAVSAGIWRSVELEVHEATEITEVAYATRSLGRHHAVLAVSWQFNTDAIHLAGFALRFTGRCGDHAFEHTEPAHFSAGSCFIAVPNPKPWWPKGYGDPHLYEVRCELIHEGMVVDTRTDWIGLRTVALERTETNAEENGGQFLFRVNGVPILCKGSNWVPLDAFHGRDAERYAPVLALCDDLGCNILRCWGGNVYEDTPFFDFCDRHGILVWQDFAFACALYPQDDAFLGRVREEAEFVVRKLRNHACLALWSGDNEIDMAYLQRGLDPAGNRISREVLPRVCAACDPYRPYLPSSPYASPAVVKGGGTAEGMMPEQHLWGPRDYFKGRYYAENTAHFASEMGYHGCPNVSSIKRFIDVEHLWPWQDNDQWRAHAADPVPEGGPFQYRTKLMADQVGELFGSIPDRLEDFALASQISQAEAKKFFIEMFRIAKWRKTGIIWWNLIDCWPQFSDAIVDYYFGKKLAYWYIKRVQQPFCIMVGEPDQWHCRVVAGNDGNTPREGTCRITDGDTGAILLERDFEVPANTNAELGRIRVSHGEHRLFLIHWESGGKAFGNHYLLGKPPFSFAQYRRYLIRIAQLPEPFAVEEIAR